MEKDLMNDSYDDYDRDTYSYDSRPNDNMGYDVFYLRNNPEPLIEEFYLYLTNSLRNTDPETMGKKPYMRIPNTQPLLNPQGVRDLVHYLRSNVNSHTVQTNINGEGLNRFMRFTSFDAWTFIVDSLDAWNLEIRYSKAICDVLVSKIELFLRRGLDDKEREHYSQEQKHEYSNINTKDSKKKSLGIPNAIGKMFNN